MVHQDPATQQNSHQEVLTLDAAQSTPNEQHATVEVIVSMLANLGIEVEEGKVEKGCEEDDTTQNGGLKASSRPNENWSWNGEWQ